MTPEEIRAELPRLKAIREDWIQRNLEIVAVAYMIGDLVEMKNSLDRILSSDPTHEQALRYKKI